MGYYACLFIFYKNQTNCGATVFVVRSPQSTEYRGKDVRDGILVIYTCKVSNFQVLCQRSIRLESNCKKGCFLSTAYDLATDRCVSTVILSFDFFLPSHSHKIILKGLGLKFIVYLHSRQCEDDEKYLLVRKCIVTV